MEQQELMVVKSNELVDAIYNMTLTEQRLILCALAQVPPMQQITDQVLYTIHASYYSDLVDRVIDGVYDDLAKAAKRLADRDVILTREANTGKELKVPLITKFIQTRSAYVDGEGCLSFRFSHDIIPYLSNLNRRFTKIHLYYATRLPSAYSLRLYEQLLKIEALPVKELEIDFIREIMRLEGRYKALKDFKKYVIDPSVEAINEYTNLEISYSQRKVGKRVAAFRFDVKFKDSPPPIPADKENLFIYKSHTAQSSSQKEDSPSSSALGKKRASSRLKKKDEYYLGIPKSRLESEARPGETWEQVAQRVALKDSAVH